MRTWLSREQAAVALGITSRTLARWEKEGSGPEYAKVGRSIRYTHGALLDWLETKVVSLGEKAPATPHDIHAVAPVGLGVICEGIEQASC